MDPTYAFQEHLNLFLNDVPYMPFISHFCKNILFVFTEKKALV